MVENENNSVLKGFCFDSFLFLFSSTEHTRRARENWLSFDMCLCIIYVFAFIANVVVAKKEEEIVKLVWKPLEIELSWLRLCLLFFQRVVQNNRHRKGRKIRGESISALDLLLIYLCVCVGVRSCLVCLTIVLLPHSRRDSCHFLSHTNRHSSR